MSLFKVYDRQIAFHRAFVDFGAGVTGALMLSQAVYWASRTKDQSGWFYKTQQDWEEETGLTRYEQEGARKRLIEAGVLQEKKVGVPCRLWYRANIELIHDLVSGNKTQYAENPQTGMRKTSILDWGKPADIHTEITTEITKNTCDEAFEAAWKAYPKRDGSNPKAAAQKCWNARLKEKVDPQVMIEGVARYASYCRLKEMVGTSYVMQAARFFGTNKEFENSWSMPTAIGGTPVKEWETPTRAQIIAKGPRRDGKVPHEKWDSGVHQFVFPVTADMVGQQ